jgi:predicted anti-sigma-YlaC factor YlaD
MMHTPYEDWLLEAEDLSPELRAELDAHLEICAECKQLADGLGGLEPVLRRLTFAEPQPGFGMRFQERLAIDRERRHWLQNIAALLFGLTATAGLVSTLAYLAWPTLRSPRLLVWAWLSQSVSFFSFAGALRGVIGSVVDGLTMALAVSWLLPMMWLMLLGGAAGLLATLWVVTYRTLTDMKEG